MSLLKINKKAVTDVDGLVLFQHSLALQEPLGTPTIFMNDVDIPDDASTVFGLFKRRALQKRSERFLEDAVRLRYGREYSSEMLPLIKRAVVTSGNSFLGINISKPGACAYPVTHVAESAFHASDTDPDHYKPPLFNLVYMPTTEGKAGAAVFENSYMEKQGNFPGSFGQWQMFLLWHEIGHGTGAGEPQSDAMSAIVCRQAFEDTNFLRAMADHRMAKVFNCLLRYDGLYSEGMPAEDDYGVPTAEALDHINNLSERSINALDEDTIRRISFQKFDHNNTVPMRVARILYQQQMEAGRRRPIREEGQATDRALLDYAQSAKEVLSEGDLKDAEEKILRRAGLAFTRIAHGAKAYEDDTDLVPEEFRESDMQAPTSFDKGEFMPD